MKVTSRLSKNERKHLRDKIRKARRENEDLQKQIHELKQFEKMYLNAKEQCDVFTKQIQELKKENERMRKLWKFKDNQKLMGIKEKSND